MAVTSRTAGQNPGLLSQGSPPPQQSQPQMPQMPSNKDSQMNALAAIIPQIMNAVGGGDRRTTALLMRQKRLNDHRTNQIQEKNSLKTAMRMVMEERSRTGTISAQRLMEISNLTGVDGTKLIGAVTQFGQHQQNNTNAKNQTDTAMLFNNMVNNDGKLPTNMNGITPTAIMNARLGYSRVKPKTELFQNYKKDGSFEFAEKELGATGNPKLDKQDKPSMIKVPDGKGGWKIINKEVGASGMNNPLKDSSSESPTRKQALTRLSNIAKQKASLDKTDEFTQLLIASNPEYAGMLGQKMSKDDKADLLKRWDEEIAYLEPFAGTTSKKDPEKTWRDYQ